jgi:hypothetical protein
MTGSTVRLELEGKPAVEGRLVAFEAEWVTVTVPPNSEVVSVPRAELVGLREVEPAAAPERERIAGIHFGMSVSLAVDAEWRMFYGFANGNVLLPLTTLTGNASWLAFSIGGGVTLPLVAHSHWRADLFAQVLPLYMGGAYSYLGIGAGIGLRYAAASGFTLGLKLPVIGYAARVGHSPYGYDPSFRANEGFGYYYLASLLGMPLLSVGYRF